MATLAEMEEQAARLAGLIAEAKKQQQIEEDSKTVLIPLQTGDGKTVLREVSMGAAKALLDRPVNVVKTEGTTEKKVASGKRFRDHFLPRKVEEKKVD